MTACFSFCTAFCFSQSIQTFADKKDILIGEQVKLKIKAIFPTGQVNLDKWFSLPDSIPHFDIIEAGKIDTINNSDNSKAIEQSITFTSFDSGNWVFPSFPLELSGTASQPVKKLQTDSIIINVSYLPDSTNQLRDIKPIIPVSFTDYTWYYIAGGIVLLLLIIGLLYSYWKKRKKLKPEEALSKLSAYDEAIQELGKLAKYDLQNADEVKMYHTKLSDIFKRYLGRKQNKNLANKTTGELLIRITEANMSQEDISTLAMALRCNDAVKFAKYIPPAAESEYCKSKLKEIIDSIEKKHLSTEALAKVDKNSPQGPADKK